VRVPAVRDPVPHFGGGVTRHHLHRPAQQREHSGCQLAAGLHDRVHQQPRLVLVVRRDGLVLGRQPLPRVRAEPGHAGILAPDGHRVGAPPPRDLQGDRPEHRPVEGRREIKELPNGSVRCASGQPRRGGDQGDIGRQPGDGRHQVLRGDGGGRGQRAEHRFGQQPAERGKRDGAAGGPARPGRHRLEVDQLANRRNGVVAHVWPGGIQHRR
jgi:hypothetical protein